MTLREDEETRAFLQAVTRRHFFRQAGFGIGSLALTALLNERLFAEGPQVAAPNPLAVRPPHFAPKAKSVIYLFMAGAPSQVDLLDPKPKLQQYDGQPIPDEFVKGERFAFIKGTPRLLGSPYPFEKVGQSGAEVSNLLPHFKSIADDVAIVRSVHTTQFNHAPAQIFMNTGHQIVGRPSIGSWLTYGLGSENKDLPGFVVLISGENNPDGGKSCWGAGFLPSVYQGVEFRNSGDPVLFLTDPPGVTKDARRDSLDVLRALNEKHLEEAGDPEILTRINSYELAYRMQSSVPELVEIAKEPAAVHAAYGTEPGKVSFANNCLLARRLVERGVRFVQLYHRGWDNHGTGKGDDIVNRLPKLCQEVDQAGGGPGEGPEAAWPPRRDPGGVGRRVRPDPHERGPQQLEVPRPRPPSAGLHGVDGGGRDQGGRHRGRHRRAGLQPGGGAGGRPRPPRHHPPPAGPRAHEAHVPLPGARLPPHRRVRQRGEEATGLSAVGP